MRQKLVKNSNEWKDLLPSIETRSLKKYFFQDELGKNSGTGEQLRPLQAALLKSFFSQRGSGAHTTQRDPARSGEYYIELRVYNTQEVEHEPNDERWKRALITLKTCTDTDTVIWRSLSNFVKAAKEDFKKIQPIMYPINLNNWLIPPLILQNKKVYFVYLFYKLKQLN